MPLIVKEEADRGAIPISHQEGTTLHMHDDNTLVMHALDQMYMNGGGQGGGFDPGNEKNTIKVTNFYGGGIIRQRKNNEDDTPSHHVKAPIFVVDKK